MFFLPSRGRVPNLTRFIDAYYDTRASAPFTLLLDRDDPELDEYEKVVLPDNWHKLYTDGGVDGLATRLNLAFHTYRNLDYYGLVGDDVLPRSAHWDKELIEAAERDHIAYGNDMIQGQNLCTHPVIGGDLVRRIGWLALPDMRALYIDTAWMQIGYVANILRYLPKVIMEHMHWSVGKAPLDATYKRHRTGVDDQAAYRAWVASPDYNRIIQAALGD